MSMQFFNMSCKDAGFKEKQHTGAHTHTLIISYYLNNLHLEPQTTIYKWLFQLGDSKSLHRKWLFHQTSIKKMVVWGCQARFLMIFHHGFHQSRVDVNGSSLRPSINLMPQIYPRQWPSQMFPTKICWNKH